jgi:SAM-dependent methyltransferase
VGRRGIPVTDDRRWVFNRLAADYAARPGYPPALVTRLLELAGGAGAAVADVGAGTGHLAIPLARLGARVSAVEPARGMLRALEAAAGAGLRTLHAAAEETGLPAGSQRLVVLAEVAAWVDPELAGREAGRVLAPGGALAVVDSRLAGSPFVDGLRELLARANFKARPAPGGRAAGVFGAAGIRGVRVEAFEHAEALDPARLEAAVRSLSWVGPALGPEGLEAVLGEARALAARHGAVWRRQLSLAWGRR